MSLSNKEIDLKISDPYLFRFLHTERLKKHVIPCEIYIYSTDIEAFGRFWTEFCNAYIRKSINSTNF